MDTFTEILSTVFVSAKHRGESKKAQRNKYIEQKKYREQKKKEKYIDQETQKKEIISHLFNDDISEIIYKNNWC